VHAAVTVPALAAAHLRRKHRFVLASNQEPSMKINQLVAALALGLALATTASAGMNKSTIVGGAQMYPTRDIIDNAVNSKDHTTLVAAVKAAGLVDTLKGAGPFTVFAPTNAAFGMLPAGTVDTLLKPENKAALTGVLTYHVVAGALDSKELSARVKAGGGSTTLTTVQGGELTVTGTNNKLLVTDEAGNVAHVTIANVYQKNGVILVVDKVLMPN
jgi:uncharacterized surface protein with fasciclin (FAS1) repeats